MSITSNTAGFSVCNAFESNSIIGTTTAQASGSYSAVVSTGASGDNGGYQAHYSGSGGGGGSMTTVNASGGGLTFWTYTGNMGSESYNRRLDIEGSGHLVPGTDNNLNLGSSAKRWANIYTGDLQLSNVTPSVSANGENLTASGNEVDGTEGTWTIQEGLNDLFLINRINGKKYKFNLTEIS